MMNRRDWLRGALALAVAGVAGCGPSAEQQDGKTGAPAATTSGTQGGGGGKSAVKVGVVLDVGGPDDESFNAAAVAGLDRAKAELGVDGRWVESKSAGDYKNNLTTLANSGYTLLFAVGYKLRDAVKEVAAQFPDAKFVLIDGDAPGLPNTAAMKFREEQGSFLAGFLAASVSKTKTIGFVGGEEIPLIKKFEAGYKAGAMAAGLKPDAVKASYTGSWEDLSKGRQQADQLFGNGVDIIFHAAGKCGLGVIEAAKSRGKGFYAIGVDSDQDGKAPGSVLTSMVKRIDVAMFNTIKAVQDGKFESGEKVYGLAEESVGLSEMKYTKQDIPADVLAKVEKLTKMVSGGTIKVPDTLEGLASFTPPKV